MTYAAVWRASWAVATGVGVGLAVLEWSVGVTLACFVLVMACATVGQLIRPTHRRETGPSADWRGMLHRSTWISAGVVAAIAVTAGSAPVGLSIVAVFALASPALWSRLTRRTRPAPRTAPTTSLHRSTPAQVPPASDRTVAALTDRELCRLWRGTFWELRTDVTQDQALAMVSLRQACLDELERRNPEAIRAWLGSGGRASGGPEKFWPDDPYPGGAHAV